MDEDINVLSDNNDCHYDHGSTINVKQNNDNDNSMNNIKMNSDLRENSVILHESESEL